MVDQAPSNVLTSGFKDVQALAIRFAKENAEAGFALAKELANARDIQGVMTLQGHYAEILSSSLTDVRPMSLADSWPRLWRA